MEEFKDEIELAETKEYKEAYERIIKKLKTPAGQKALMIVASGPNGEIKGRKMNALRFEGRLAGIEVYESSTLPFDKDGKTVHWVQGPTDRIYFVSNEYFERLRTQTEVEKEVFDLWNL